VGGEVLAAARAGGAGCWAGRLGGPIHFFYLLVSSIKEVL
jgi:hypothetical protein